MQSPEEKPPVSVEKISYFELATLVLQRNKILETEQGHKTDGLLLGELLKRICLYLTEKHKNLSSLSTNVLRAYRADISRLQNTLLLILTSPRFVKHFDLENQSGFANKITQGNRLSREILISRLKEPFKKKLKWRMLLSLPLIAFVTITLSIPLTPETVFAMVMGSIGIACMGVLFVLGYQMMKLIDAIGAQKEQIPLLQQGPTLRLFKGERPANLTYTDESILLLTDKDGIFREIEQFDNERLKKEETLTISSPYTILPSKEGASTSISSPTNPPMVQPQPSPSPFERSSQVNSEDTDMIRVDIGISP